MPKIKKPRRKLTDAAIQRFHLPKEGTTEHFDAGYPGLAIRVGNGGVKSFVLFHRVGGKLTRTTLGRWPRVSLADAHAAWRNVAEDKSPTPEKESSGELFSTVVESWLKLDAAQRNRPSSLKVIHWLVDHDILPAFRDMHIQDIGKKEVAALINPITVRAPAKALQVYAYLARMFKWAVGQGHIEKNPMEGIQRPKKGQSRERVLSDDELRKVWKACDGVPGSVVRMLILTGARREEIAQLKWSEIHGDRIELANGRTKNGESHIIPLSPQARKLLDSTQRDGDYVFSMDGQKPVTAWSRAKSNLDKACKVEGWTIHDLRRTCATGMQKLGVSLQAVEAVLNHTSGSRAGVVGIYQRHAFADEKRAALEAWAKHVAKLTK